MMKMLHIFVTLEWAQQGGESQGFLKMKDGANTLSPKSTSETIPVTTPKECSVTELMNKPLVGMLGFNSEEALRKGGGCGRL